MVLHSEQLSKTVDSARSREQRALMDADSLAKELHECARLLETDALSAKRLRACAETAKRLIANERRRRQDILYLWTLFSSVTSKVNGMALIEDGEEKRCEEDPEHWPYQSVLEAMNDGWRVISFPNMALMMDDSKTYGLGNEFILEKIRDAPPVE